MAFQRLRRALLAAACLGAGLLAACGGSDVVSQLTPQRIVTFGDGFGDLGQGGSRYTVNDGSTNIWSQQLAARYGLPLAASASGGTAFAAGLARVAAEPDAAGNPATPTVAEQIDAFLAAGGPATDDLILVSAGVADVVHELRETQLGGQASEQGVSDLAAAGRQLGQQVQRLVQAGARNVLVVGPYDLGISPYAREADMRSLAQAYSKEFITALKVAMVDLGGRVLYVDLEDYFNRIVNNPGIYGMRQVAAPVCTSVDPGPGIGTGTGQVNSALCTPATLQPGANPSEWLFADRVYPTPAAHRGFGDFAFDTLRRFW